MTAALRIREIPAGASLREFIDLSWRINAADPNWIAPLRMQLKGVLDRKRHPFHRHAEVAYFVAERGGRAAGRVAAIHNRQHNEFHGDRVGFFGLFEAQPDEELATALLNAAAEWLAARGCDTMRGPVNLSTNDEFSSPGFLVEGFDRPPAIMMSHNPPYYAGLAAAAGLVPAQDLLSFFFDRPENVPERGARLIERIVDRHRVTIRNLDLKRFRSEVDAIKQVYNAAWSRNWGFVPMTDAEFDHLAREFRPIVDPDLCLIAEVDGTPIGFSLALPDLNQALRYLPNGRLFPFGVFRFLWHRRRIDAIRVLTLGFRPEYQHAGLGSAFYLKTWLTGTAKGFVAGEASWILEDNLEMVRALERIGGRIVRRYRLFQRPLDAGR